MSDAEAATGDFSEFRMNLNAPVSDLWPPLGSARSRQGEQGGQQGFCFVNVLRLNEATISLWRPLSVNSESAADVGPRTSGELCRNVSGRAGRETECTYD